MTPGPNDRGWMLPLLSILFEEFTTLAAVRLLRDDLAREAFLPLLAAALERRGTPGDGLAADDGDSLLQGLLALRTKFPLVEAQEKVRVNIAMRGGER